MRILAIDPGARESGVVEFLSGKVFQAGVVANQTVMTLCCEPRFDVVAIEDFVTYRAVDRNSRETLKWIGAFRWWAEHYTTRVLELTRSEIKSHLCGGCKGIKDSHVWAACCDWYGLGTKEAKGTKKDPGPLYEVKSHARSALAVALVAHDRLEAADAAEEE